MCGLRVLARKRRSLLISNRHSLTAQVRWLLGGLIWEHAQQLLGPLLQDVLRPLQQLPLQLLPQPQLQQLIAGEMNVL